MESCTPLARLIRVRVLLHNPKRTPRRTRSSGSGSSVASLPRIPFPPAPSRSPSPCFLRSAAAPAVSRPYLRSSRGARRSTTPSSTLRSPATARRGSACWAIREGSPFLMAGRFSLARPVLFVVVYLPSCLFDRAIATVICSAFCSRSPRPLLGLRRRATGHPRCMRDHTRSAVPLRPPRPRDHPCCYLPIARPFKFEFN